MEGTIFKATSGERRASIPANPSQQPSTGSTGSVSVSVSASATTTTSAETPGESSGIAPGSTSTSTPTSASAFAGQTASATVTSKIDSGAGPSFGLSSSTTGEKHAAPISISGGLEAQNKRRRGLGIVTPNACTECRKKRAKCDGHKPCGRCRVQNQKDACLYEVPVRQSKETLRNEIEELRRQQQQNNIVLTALRQSDLWEDVLRKLRNGQSVDQIADWLGSAWSGGGGGGGGGGGAGGTLAYTHGEPLSASTVMQSSPLSAGFRFDGSPAGHRSFGSLAEGASMGMGSSQQPSDPRLSYLHPSGLNIRGSHPDAMQWQPDPPSQPVQPSSDYILQDRTPDRRSVGQEREFHGLDQVLAPLDESNSETPACSWTEVTDNSHLVRHLLALYFCWEYPTFASLSKEHFIDDFRTGRPRFCSSVLVNALLALGCRFSGRSDTRAIADDPYTSGDHFFKETLRLLQNETDHHKLTTIQALGIMSIREASCGRDSESWYYAGQSIRMAIEMGLHQVDGHGDEDEMAVQSATFWGAFALDHAWSLATGSLPQSSCFPRLPPKPAIISDIEASVWIPYTDDGSNNPGAPLQRTCEQPSNVRSVYTCFCELSELVHQSLYVLHSPGRPVTSRDLLKIYREYLNWYGRIPEVLRLGHNFTPAVLFAHMYYHFAILLLFRPLIKLRIIGSSVLPRDVCTQAADAIQGLLRSYSSLYTLKRTPSFVPYFVLTSTIMHLAVASDTMSSTPPNCPPAKYEPTRPASSGDHAHPQPPTVSVSTPLGQTLDPQIRDKEFPKERITQALQQGIADLSEMAPCHHFAEQALHILRYLAGKWKIDVDIPSHRSRGVSTEHSNSLVKPHTSSLNFFVPGVIADDFICAWGTSTKQRPGPIDLGGMGTSHISAAMTRESIAEAEIMKPLARQQSHPPVILGPPSILGPTNQQSPIPSLTLPQSSSSSARDSPASFLHPRNESFSFASRGTASPLLDLANAAEAVGGMGFGSPSSSGIGSAASSATVQAKPGVMASANAMNDDTADPGAGPMAHLAKSIENPLFWPFPMQGRPMVPSGPELEQAGFALLSGLHDA